MPKQVHDYVVHPLTMGPKHCHADCPFLSHWDRGRVECRLFNQNGAYALSWDVRRKLHGNLRCRECLEKVL